MKPRTLAVCLLPAAAMFFVACGGSASTSDPETATGDEAPAEAREPEPEALSVLDDLGAEVRDGLTAWQGDLDGMIERRLIRVLTVFNPMLYFLDGPRQRGVVFEAASELQKTLNRKLKLRRLQVEVLIIPVSRDELIPALLDGRGDIAIANLTITPDRSEQVDFTRPLLQDVREIVVTGPGAPQLQSLEDLSGVQLRLRRSSSYWSSIERLNVSLKEAGRPEVRLEPASSWVEDHDLLELVHSGNLPLTVVDNHKARFWAQFLDELELREDLVLRRGADIAWAFRKNSPKLEAELNGFVRLHRKGTLFGNVVFKRYLEDNEWVSNAVNSATMQRFERMEQLFRKYAEMYELDWLLLIAQGFQESGLDNDRRSRAGAVGVMQVRPVAAREIGLSDVHQLENNIHAGAKYLRYIMDKYFGDEGLDPAQQQLFGLAAYNAGPSRIRKLQRQAGAKGLDPKVWFNNVEVLAARSIGAETVRYVSNITKYYVTYRLEAQRREVRSAGQSPSERDSSGTGSGRRQARIDACPTLRTADHRPHPQRA